MRHTLEIDEDTWEQIEDEINRVVVLHEGAGVLKSYLGTSVGAAASTLGLVVLLLSFPQTQAAMVSFIAFIRTQIAAIARDIAKEFVPTAEDIVEEIAGAANDVAEKARQAAKELFDEIERRLAEQEVVFGGTGPVGLPIDPALAEKLRKEGIQDPL